MISCQLYQIQQLRDMRVNLLYQLSYISTTTLKGVSRVVFFLGICVSHLLDFDIADVVSFNIEYFLK